MNIEGGRVVIFDVGHLTSPDMVIVDALARLQLTALRLGCRIELRRPCDELLHLLELTGLGDVLRVKGNSGERCC